MPFDHFKQATGPTSWVTSGTVDFDMDFTLPTTRTLIAAREVREREERKG